MLRIIALVLLLDLLIAGVWWGAFTVDDRKLQTLLETYCASPTPEDKIEISRFMHAADTKRFFGDVCFGAIVVVTVLGLRLLDRKWNARHLTRR